jgi:hypothetical protein
MIKRLEDIIFLFPFRKITTLKKWCERNGVEIMDQDKIPYVYSYEFNLAFHRKYIERIKLKYPNNWSSFFSCIQEDDFSGFLKLNLESEIRILNNSTYQRSNSVEQIKNELMNRKNKK